ncbi:7870_t:CDS:2 [Diversispora eburnea]|uniref:7870_t:CDS:1 n=1 Tax=Diversispora eburnea TaxID=1213867 RepID=A0A9N9AY93_9GLOM|nr:7870_t:CDS:2 [Diversispora eburnea]
MSVGNLFDEVCVYLSQVIDYITYAYNTFLSIIFLRVFKQQPFQVHLPTKTFHPAVLVTGTSSGIGRNVAITLAIRGYTVFATIRREEDAKELQENFKQFENPKGGILHTLIMDVTKKDDISNAHMAVKSRVGHEIPFIGLINNASFVRYLPLEVASEDAYAESFNTNFFGIVNVTKKFLPLLREDRGRVINIGSIASWEASPFMGVYASTKAAVRALTRIWRMEARSTGVHFSLIEPGIISTRLSDQIIENYRSFTSFPSNSRYYAIPHSITSNVIKSYENMYRMVGKWGESFVIKAAPPDIVTDAIVHALTAPFPKNTYYVGLDARFLATLNWLLGDRISEAVQVKALTHPIESIHT